MLWKKEYSEIQEIRRCYHFIWSGEGDPCGEDKL